MPVKMRHSTSLLAVALMAPAAAPAQTETELSVQSRYPPLQFEGAAPGGAHPIGGPSKAFVDRAGAILEGTGLALTLHVSGEVSRFDAGTVEPPAVSRREWGTLHAAVAAGPEAGGLAAALGIPANSGLAFGEMLSGGVPFGMTADELMGWVYAGGGLELHQAFYDEAFDGALKVLPVAITGAQAAGFFPEPLPAEGGDAAMAAFCAMPIILRYPGGARAIIRDACEAVGGGVDSIGRATRCERADAPCGPGHPGNPVVNPPQRLTFGGFAPGMIPHSMAANGNIDAFELNMPAGHVQFLKLAAGQADRPDAEADLAAVTPPWFYVTGWHQPWLYAELIVNRAVWDGLGPERRRLIEAAARESVLATYAERSAMQGAAVRTLEAAGATALRWPDALAERLRAAAPGALSRMAETAAAEGDDTLARLLASMDAYAKAQAAWFDSDDLGQGSAGLPERP